MTVIEPDIERLQMVEIAVQMTVAVGDDQQVSPFGPLLGYSLKFPQKLERTMHHLRWHQRAPHLFLRKTINQ